MTNKSPLHSNSTNSRNVASNDDSFTELSRFGYQTVLPHITQNHMFQNQGEKPKQVAHSPMTLELPSSYRKEEWRSLRKLAYKQNKKILKQYKKERMEFEKRMGRNEAELPPIDVKTDPNLQNAFVMIPYEYITAQTDANSLTLFASMLEPGVNEVSMPEVMALNETKQQIWKNPSHSKIREDWLKERMEYIKYIGLHGVEM